MTWEEFEKTLPPMFNNFMFKGMIKANFEKMKANPEMLAQMSQQMMHQMPMMMQNVGIQPEVTKPEGLDFYDEMH